MPPRDLPPYARYAAAGFQFFGAIAGSALAGWWLDGKFATAPWLAVVGVLLGSVVGFWNLWRLIK